MNLANLNRHFKPLLLVLFILTCNLSIGQDTLTVREVFDFQPGDIFHYLEDKGSYGYFSTTQEKRVNRITILDRQNSVTGDTMIYTRNVEGYEYYVSGYEEDPYYKLFYDYRFFEFRDTVFYPHTDSSIFTYLFSYYANIIDPPDENFPPDTLAYYSNALCNRDINGFLDMSWNYTNIEFGKGIGLTKLVLAAEECNCKEKDYQLIYFKKSEESCGTPDNYTAIHDPAGQTELRIFPNPASVFINIDRPASGNYTYDIYDISGRHILSGLNSGKLTRISISQLESGVYLLSVNINGRRKVIRRFIKK